MDKQIILDIPAHRAHENGKILSDFLGASIDGHKELEDTLMRYVVESQSFDYPVGQIAALSPQFHCLVALRRMIRENII